MSVSHELEGKRNNDFDINMTSGENGEIVIKAGMGNETYRYRASEPFELYVPTLEDLEEMDDEEREDYESYDPTAEYLKKCEPFDENYDELKRQADILTDALLTADSSRDLSEEAEQAYKLLSGLLGKATSQATADMYRALPVKTRHLVEYAERLVQLRHLLGGSTYTSSMDHLYTPEEIEKCVDDFWRGAEAALSAGISDRLKTPCAVEIERPTQVRYLNASTNLAYSILQEVGINDSAIPHAMLKDATQSLTQDYRDKGNQAII